MTKKPKDDPTLPLDDDVKRANDLVDAADKAKDEKPPPLPASPSQAAAGKELAKPAPTTPVPVMPGNLDGLWKLSDALSRAGILPSHLTDDGRAEREVVKANVFWIIQCGAELGIPPTQAIMGMAIINDKPCVYGDLLIGKVRSSGKVTYIEEWIEGKGDDAVAHCKAKRSDTGEVIERRFSWAEAKNVVQHGKYGDKSLVDKNTWQNYPLRMLQHRARGFCLRDLFADVLHGIRSAEEEEDQAFIGPEHAKNITPRPEPAQASEAPPVIEWSVEVETSPEEAHDATTNEILNKFEGAVNIEALDTAHDNAKPLIEDLPEDLQELLKGKYEELRAGLNPLRGG